VAAEPVAAQALTTQLAGQPAAAPSMTAAPVAASPATTSPLVAPPLTVQAIPDQSLAAQSLTAQSTAAPAMAAGPVDGAGGAGAGTGHIHQSVLTGNIRSVAEVKLAALGLREWLDLCIGAYGDDHEDRTELVEVARRRAAAVHGRSAGAFDGTATVVIGDTPLDIAAALAAGARAVGVATGSHSADDLTMAGADAVLADLTDTAAVLRALLA
jgi:hypothetical protein